MYHIATHKPCTVWHLACIQIWTAGKQAQRPYMERLGDEYVDAVIRDMAPKHVPANMGKVCTAVLDVMHLMGEQILCVMRVVGDADIVLVYNEARIT